MQGRHATILYATILYGNSVSPYCFPLPTVLLFIFLIYYIIVQLV